MAIEKWLIFVVLLVLQPVGLVAVSRPHLLMSHIVFVVFSFSRCGIADAAQSVAAVAMPAAMPAYMHAAWSVHTTAGSLPAVAVAAAGPAAAPSAGLPAAAWSAAASACALGLLLLLSSLTAPSGTPGCWPSEVFSYKVH